MTLAFVLAFLLPVESAAAEKGRDLKPGGGHEECLELRAGQELKYSFTSNAPLDFNIHYHAGEEVFYPVKRDGSKKEGGTFKPETKQEYCLMWTNAAKKAAKLKYSFSTSPQ